MESTKEVAVANHPAIYGIALIVGALGGVVTMALHPTGHDLLATASEVARRNEQVTVATHSIALMALPILLFGFLGLSRRLGINRALVSAALIAYAFGLIAAMCATVLNGLVAPTLTRQILTSDDATRQHLQVVLMNNDLLNQAFSKIYLTASSIAVILWSIAMFNVSRFAKWIGLAGCLFAFGFLALFFAGHLRLNVHGFGLFIFAQSLWTILVGVFSMSLQR